MKIPAHTTTNPSHTLPPSGARKGKTPPPPFSISISPEQAAEPSSRAWDGDRRAGEGLGGNGPPPGLRHNRQIPLSTPLTRRVTESTCSSLPPVHPPARSSRPAHVSSPACLPAGGGPSPPPPPPPPRACTQRIHEGGRERGRKKKGVWSPSPSPKKGRRLPRLYRYFSPARKKASPPPPPPAPEKRWAAHVFPGRYPNPQAKKQPTQKNKCPTPLPPFRPVAAQS